jgi:predicted amidophosphoribosyltransferase
MKKTKKLPNGEAVREFYLSIALIKEYYWDKGYRKKAYLYRTLKEKLGWKMSLEAFKYHFNKEFKKDDVKKEEIKSNIQEKTNSDKDPIIAYPNFSKVKKFIPYSD